MTLIRPLAVVAEDEVLLRMEAADLLERLGFDVLEAGHALAALTCFERHEDVALLHTDVRMPGGRDGVDLAHEVARRWPSVAIIVCSGFPASNSRKLPERSYFIDKPCLDAMLRKALRTLNVQYRFHI